MKQIYLYWLLLAASCISGNHADAQKKLLVLGSSTPACYNLSFDSCYVGRLQRHFQLKGTPVVIDNRAVGGDNCYQGMPTWYTPPAGRNAPRPYSNISDGLQGNPDIVLVNYPSNGYDTYSVEEVLFCLRTIKQTANNAGKPCYIATSQPRSEPASYQAPEVRQRMQTIKERILSEFGQYAINFWDGIVNPANNFLLDQYNSGDGTHLNSAGHNVLFNRVAEKNLFGQQPSGLTYRYYEGSWNTLPDFNALTPVKTGSAANISLEARNTNDYFGFVWEGSIHITTPGWYTFETVSDDGSKFYFNSSYAAGANALVSNDGTHGPVSAYGSVYIAAAGSYPVAASFFEKTAGEVMQLYWSGPGIERQPVPDYAFLGTPPQGSGLSYRYYEGSWSALPDFSQLQPVKTGSSANVDIAERTPGRDNNFAFLWQGTINIPVAGTYTFETISDDGSKVYFNSLYHPSATPTVNNDGLHAPVSASGSVYVPSAGAYPISITFFEKEGSEHMQVFWSGPGFGRQLVPDAAFGQGSTPPPAGLNYKYYEGNFDALPDFNALTPLKTGTSPNIDLGIRSAGVDDRFAIMWQGYINLPAAGTYTFETFSDDGSKVYFDMPYSAGAGSLVNNDGRHAPQAATGTVTVRAAGRYPIVITYFEKDGWETMQLYWTGPGISRQQVPDQAFSVSNSAAGSAVLSRVQQMQATDATRKTSYVTASIYPNPFVQSFTIDYYHERSSLAKVSIGLYDLNGKLVHMYQPATLVQGLNRWRVNTGGKKLGAGVYVAHVNIDGVAVKAMKVVKVR